MKVHNAIAIHTGIHPIKNLGFSYKHFMQSSFPYKNPKTSFFERTHGKFSFSLSSSNNKGLPYGIIPRLFMVWLVSEVMRLKTPLIQSGLTLNGLLQRLGLNNSGGVRGDRTRLKEQLLRIIHTSYSVKHNDNGNYKILNSFFIEEAHLSRSNTQQDIHLSFRLAPAFYEEIMAHSIPVDLEMTQIFSSSCLALDIYTWLAYRKNTVKDRVFISWNDLKKQFGIEYKDDRFGMSNFKKSFKEQLAKITNRFTALSIGESEDKKGLLLMPCRIMIGKKIQPLTPIDFDTVQNEENTLSNRAFSVQQKNITKTLIDDYGFSQYLSHKIAATASIETIELALEAVKEKITEGKAINNIKAFLRAAIKEGWTPKNHISSAAKEKKEQQQKNIELMKENARKQAEREVYMEEEYRRLKNLHHEECKKAYAQIDTYVAEKIEEYYKEKNFSSYDPYKDILKLSIFKREFYNEYMEYEVFREKKLALENVG